VKPLAAAARGFWRRAGEGREGFAFLTRRSGTDREQRRGQNWHFSVYSRTGG